MEEIKVNLNYEYKELDYDFISTYQVNPSFSSYTHEQYKSFIGNDAYFLPKPMPSFIETILNNDPFDYYEIKSPGFHRIRPGMGLPLHVDEYKKFRELHNIKNVDDVRRYIIFLESSKPGHIAQIGDKIYNDWKAGNYISWEGPTEHAALNLGTSNRYTLQITCLRHTTY